MGPAVRASGVALLLCLAATLAFARHHHRYDESAHGAAVAGQFDYYLLSLSWSPTYCLTHGTDRDQCGSKGYGFVLHGLWPQYSGGGYPENCATDAPLDAARAASVRACTRAPNFSATNGSAMAAAAA